MMIGKKWIIYINERNFLIGGLESLTVRILLEAKSQGYNVAFLSPLHEDIDETWVNIFKKNDIFVNISQSRNPWKMKHYFKNIFSQILNSNDSITFITYTLFSRSIIDYYARRYLNKMNYHNLSYVVHPHIFTSEYSLIKYINKYTFINSRKDSIIYMDEECRDTTLNFYALNNASTTIVRLGLNWDDYPAKTISNKLATDTINILSISRMDFPFKGYVIGLVSDFAKLAEKYDTIQLTIIGDGEGFAYLKDVISSYDTHISEKITLTGNIAYNELKKYFDSAKIYVGMGTTLLDAAKEGVPGISAVAYQLSNFSNGYYLEDIACLGGTYNPNHTYYTFYELLEKMIALSKNEYLHLSKLTYDSVKKEYDIKRTLPELLSKHPKEVSKTNALISLILQYLLESMRRSSWWKKKISFKPTHQEKR